MLKRSIVLLIDVYRYFISPMLPAACRFHPSCSCYARESLLVHGFWKGSLLSIRRLSKCHPFHPGGSDPVPPMDSQV